MRAILLLAIGTIIILIFFSIPWVNPHTTGLRPWLLSIRFADWISSSMGLRPWLSGVGVNPVRNGISDLSPKEPESGYIAGDEDSLLRQDAISSDEAHSAQEVSRVLRETPPATGETRPRFNKYVLPPLPTPSTTTRPDLATTTQSTEVKISPPNEPTLPPLDEETIFKAVVKIECPTKNGLGKYIGSGFVLPGDIVVTAAHVVGDSGSKGCTVIFSRERKPIHYLKGTIRDFDKLKERLDERGIDFALLDLPPLSSYPEARAIFTSYPWVPYSFCEDPKMLGDTTYHYGYPANFKDLDYLERLKGEALEYADVEGTESKVSEDGASYKAPIFSSNADEFKLHPYMVSRTGVFYGASGGLAFNATKQCILGPHHGFSVGSSESFSIFMVLGWEKVKNLLIK